MQDDVTVAARNNAAWCDVIGRLHGARPIFTDDAWTSASRTPPLYPDAVTLRPGQLATDLLSRVDSSPGCSIKDSFACLDLSPYGFHVLFQAQWTRLTAGETGTASGSGIAWHGVSEDDELCAWEAAWRGGGGGAGAGRRIFLSELLSLEDVAFLAGIWRDRIVAGAIINRTDEVIGLSNYFEHASAAGTAWQGCVAAITSLHPGAPVVGYEQVRTLTDTRRHGLEILGPLRVWTNSLG